MSSGIGILNQTYDNLEKRIRRVESQLGRPRSCKYGTTTERTNYAAPVDGLLWWDTTEEVLYIWYNYKWTLAKGVMVGGTTEREATSLPTAGGMWWDTDEDNLYVWGASNSWQSVAGAKFGTRGQRDAGGFGGALWICTDEGYSYVYDPSGRWRGIGESVFDWNWLYTTGGDFAIMGHRTNYGLVGAPKRRDIQKTGKYAKDSYLKDILTRTGPLLYGQDKLVPYVDFSDGNTLMVTNTGSADEVLCYLTPAGTMTSDTPFYTIMVWFKIHEYSAFQQPIIGCRKKGTIAGHWLLYVGGDSYNYSGGSARRLVWQDSSGPVVSLNTWHFAAVMNGWYKMDDGDWSTVQRPINFSGPGSIVPGYLSYAAYEYRPHPNQLLARCHLHGRVSMYYTHADVNLTVEQIDMFYERTRRLHGV